MRYLRCACLVSALMGSSSLVPVAMAQQAPAAEEARDTIVVTARRREEDLQDVARYVVRNPIRAGLVRSVHEYSLWDAVWIHPKSG